MNNGPEKIDIENKTDDEIADLILSVFKNHKRRGAINVLNAKCNEDVRKHIYEKTKFFEADPKFSFINFSTRAYMVAHKMTLDDFPICPSCNEHILVNVVSVHQGFTHMYCSLSCAASNDVVNDKRKATKLARYGDENYNNREQREQTCFEKFGFRTNFMCEDTKRKSEQTKLEKYGDAHFTNPAKAKQTCLETYGQDYYNNPQQISKTKKRKAAEDPDYIPNIQAKAKKTKLELYGDENWNNPNQMSLSWQTHAFEDPNFVSDITERRRDTKLERYGDPTYNNMEKRQQTCMELYGAEEYFASEDYRLKSEQTCLAKYGETNYTKTEQFRLKSALSKNTKYYSKIIDDICLCEPLFSFDEYFNSRDDDLDLKWKCKTCGTEFMAPVNFELARESPGQYARCPHCFPIESGTSGAEKSLRDFITGSLQGQEITSNDRSIITPLEIDINIKSMKTGFEFDGIYWHCDMVRICPQQLLNKTLKCNDAGFRLVHVFEDEWKLKREQVESQVLRVLGINRESCSGCEVKDLSYSEAQKFIDKNSFDIHPHIGRKAKCLTIGDVIVSVMTYDITRETIMIRAWSDALGHNFDDSFDVLSRAIAADNAQLRDSITMSIDLRWFEAKKFVDLGFSVVKTTKPARWLIDMKDWVRTEKNTAYDAMKSLCESYDNDKTLVMNLHANGYASIYDCGQVIMTKQLSKQSQT